MSATQKKAAAVVIVIGIAALGWFFFMRREGGLMQGIVESGAAASSSLVGAAAAPAPLAASTPQTAAVDANTRLYRNAQFRFSLQYPRGLAVVEYQERGGALTVTFANGDESRSFEVYVTPYSGAQITKQRFLTDEPSGVFQEPQDVMIDGARATMFFGQNPIMGDTREVWFIRGGLLYEVATYKALDSWLAGIMQTWRFL